MWALLTACLLPAVFGCSTFHVNHKEKYGEDLMGFNVGLSSNAAFGYDVAWLGDINGDGFGDIAVGARGYRSDEGAVFILFLDADRTVTASQRLSDESGGIGPLYSDEFFGAAVHSPGDINGDGINDLAIGAFGEDELYVCLLTAAGTVSTFFRTQEAYLSQFGRSISSAGDLDGDGVVDLILGIPATGGGDGGLIFFYLNADGTEKTRKVRTSAIPNRGSGHYIGRSITHIGDLNGDGKEDIAVGGHFGERIMIIFLGGSDGSTILDTVVHRASSFSGISSGYFGTMILNLGDIDGDGVVDLLVGAMTDGDGGVDTGATYVLFLNEDGTITKTPRKISALSGMSGQINGGDIFGSGGTVTGGDINGDGFVDVIVGASGSYVAASKDGAAFFLSLGCEAACYAPGTAPTGYGILDCDTTEWNLPAFKCSVACATGYSGIALASCPTTGSEMSFTGCSGTCSSVSQTGYDIAGCDTTGGQTTAAECVVLCSPGYTGTVAVTCPAGGGTFSFSGCTICPAGLYKEASGSSACLSCDPNAFSDPGSASASDCTCLPGYTGDGLTCELVACTREAPSAGELSSCGSDSTFGDMCDWSCAVGYSGTSRTRECSSSGSWVGTAVVCTADVCAREPTGVGEVNSCDDPSLFTEECTWTCSSGYSGASTTRSCTAGGVWSGPTISCLAPCEVPIIPGGTWSGVGCTAGATIPSGTGCTFSEQPTIACINIGFRTCTDGSFDAVPACQGSCPLPTIVGGSWSCSGVGAASGTTCVFNALAGYDCTLVGPRLCTNGSWDMEFSTCVDIDDCLGMPCGPGGTCYDGLDSFTCGCSTGYENDGSVCIDINGCTSNTCGDGSDGGATCDDVDAPGVGFTCTCSAGYKEKDGVCIESDCAPPGGNNTLPGTCSRLHSSPGTSCAQLCQPGYSPKSSLNITCAAGAWSSTPECEPSGCHFPPSAVLNGQEDVVILCNQGHDGECFLGCDLGYVASDLFTCRFGEWSAPTCDAIAECAGEPPSGLNRRPEPGCAGTANGASCPVQCNPGYVAAVNYVCDKGSWVDAECTLIAEFCGSPDGLATDADCDTKINGQCGPFACDAPLVLPAGAPAAVVCTVAANSTRGAWLPEPPACLAAAPVDGVVAIAPGEAQASGVFVYIVIGLGTVLLLCGCILALVAFQQVKKKNRKSARRKRMLTEEAEGTIMVDLNSDLMGARVKELVDSGEAKHIGTGGAADIYKGKLNGEMVAIKMLRSKGEAHTREFHKEIAVISKLTAAGGHHNVVRLIYCAEDASSMVLELCSKGSLKERLAKKKISVDEKTVLLGNIASGLRFCHDNRIAHLDVKAANVLIDHDNIVKISDFGSAEEVTGPVIPGIFNGTAQYAAGERLRTGCAIDLLKCDSYSLAVTAWAMFTRKEPYEGVSANEVVLAKREGRAESWEGLPPLPQPVSACIWRGLDDEPFNRPTMEEWMQACGDNDATVMCDLGSATLGSSGMNGSMDMSSMGPQSQGQSTSLHSQGNNSTSAMLS